MKALPRRAQLYLVTLWCVAAVLAGLALWLQPIGVELIVLIVLGSLAYALADYFEVEIVAHNEQGVSMTLADVPTIFFVATFGTPALLAIAIGSCLADVLHHRPWYRVLFNASTRTIVYLTLVTIFTFAAPQQGNAFSGLWGLLLVIILGVTYYTLNTVLVSTIIALASQKSLLLVYRSSFRVVHWVHFMMIPFGVLLSVVWQIDRWLLIPTLIPLIMTHRAFEAVAGWHAESRRSNALAAESQQLTNKLEQLQHSTTLVMQARSSRDMLIAANAQIATQYGASAHWLVMFDDGEPRLLHASGAESVDQASLTRYAVLLGEGQVRLLAAGDLEALELAVLPEWHAVISVPLLLETQLQGVMYFAVPSAVTLTNADERILFSFAAHVALGVTHLHQSEVLQQKQAELVRSSKLAVLGTFASGIAHEFNNLLAGMLGYAQLGRMSDSRAEKDEVLEFIERASIRGGSITRGLLMFARQGPTARALHNLGEVVRDTVHLVERELAKQNIQVHQQLEDTASTWCDGGQLSQVVLNILTNARDALAQKQGGEITISLRQLGDQLELQIADTGTGMPPEVLERAFQPFVTTKGAYGSGKESGTGLGLAICYGIVESHGGSIQLASMVGQGTTVTVSLPILTQAVTRDTEPDVAVVPQQLRILLVDDDPAVGEPLARILRKYGYLVSVMQSPELALRLYRQHPFDLVCCDLVMPVMNGVAFVRALHSFDPNAQVIIMTGQHHSPLLDEVLTLPVDAVLKKPFSANDLLGAIERVGRTTLAESSLQANVS